MGAGAMSSRAEHAGMAPALNRDEGAHGEVVFVHTQPVSSLLTAVQCQSHAELLLCARGEPWNGAAAWLGIPGTAGVELTSVFLENS